MSSVLAPDLAENHSIPAHEVVVLLQTDRADGLSLEDVARRAERFGPNELPPARRGGALRRLLRQFHASLVYVLIVAGAITAALGEYVDASVIFGVVLVNAFIGFVQESKAEAALEGLRSLGQTRARVVRDGRERTVPSVELVPGDLVLVEAGDRIPADLRLIRSADLRVDESALTGESVPVDKDEVVLPAATPVADRNNMAYSATLATAGSGAGVVVATGSATELGEIHRLVGAAEPFATPLTLKLAKFSRALTVAILALAAVTFAVGLVRGQGGAETFTAAIALAVGAIPEGLPAAVTITLAIGVGRMARRRAVIRTLPAAETLGSTTVICTDKTGTLTENQMTVRALWTPCAEYEVTGSGYAPQGAVVGEDATVPGGTDHALRWCLLAGALCNDAALVHDQGRWSIVGDPTEAAMLVAAAKAGLDPAGLARTYPRLATIPFDSGRRYMATLHREKATGVHVAVVKGSVEQVSALCGAQLGADGEPQPLDREAVLRAAETLAARGLRVLATAMNPAADPAYLDQPVQPGTLVLTGLQAMFDPPRPAAASAIRACHDAGLSVKMITGDHAATATAIAGRIGLFDASARDRADVLTGAELAELREDEFPDAVDRARVFARVSPEQKLRLVEALQARGHVVAMTGDGVNDAPALRQANIGVAMGRSGTEVAKDAADMVLTDDDFATIEAAVEEGRGVFANLVKFIVWTLPTNIAEGLVILVAVLLGVTLPILPTQILWINMTTAVALGLMLAFEPKEPGIMRRPPRDSAQPLLGRPLLARILLVCALLVGGTWWLFTWEQASGATLAEARTAALNLFVVAAAFYLFSCRSMTGSAWRLGPLSNRWILVGVTVQAVGQLALTYLPALNTVFHTTPLGPQTWLRVFTVALAVAAVVALEKTFTRSTTARWARR